MVAAPSINIKRVMSKPDQDNMPDDKRSRGDLDNNEATLTAVEQLSLDDGTNNEQQQDNIPTTPPLMVGSWPPFSNMTIPKREMSTHSTLSDEEEALTSSPGGMRVRVQGTLNVPTSTTTNNNSRGTPPRPPTMIATSNSETNLRRQISDGSSNSPPTNRNNNNGNRDNSNSNRSLHSRSSSEGNGTRGTSGPGGDNKSVGNWGWFEDVHAHENAFLPGISAGGRSRDNSMKKGRGTANRDGKKKGGGLFHIGSELMSNVIGAFEQPKQGKICVDFVKVYLGILFVLELG